jgi:hypothetical protein
LTSEDTSDGSISIGVNRRAIGSTAGVTGILMLLAIIGIVTGQQVAGKVLFLVIIGPMFVLSLVTALRRRPILVLEAERLIDTRGNKTLQWNAVVDARLTESKGLFGRAYHQLEISGASSGDGAGPVPASDPIRVKVDSIDQLSLPWERIAALVEERLPETVPLIRASTDGRTVQSR